MNNIQFPSEGCLSDYVSAVKSHLSRLVSFSWFCVIFYSVSFGWLASLVVPNDMTSLSGQKLPDTNCYW